MRKRLAEEAAAYEASWAGGAGSHHPDFDPDAAAAGAPRASRATEELYNAVVADDVSTAYAKLEAGADANWEFGVAYKCQEGYTPLMVAAHRCGAGRALGRGLVRGARGRARADTPPDTAVQSPEPPIRNPPTHCSGRLECAKALLRAGADPNHVTAGGDAALFWAIDGGADMIKLFVEYGARLDEASPKAGGRDGLVGRQSLHGGYADRAEPARPPQPPLAAHPRQGWTSLQYAKAKGKYGATEDKGVYPEARSERADGAGRVGRGGRAGGGPSLHPAPPARLLPTIPPLQDVLKFYGATKYGSGPPALGSRSPRESFNPSAPDFLAERGSYQAPAPHP